MCGLVSGPRTNQRVLPAASSAPCRHRARHQDGRRTPRYRVRAVGRGHAGRRVLWCGPLLSDAVLERERRERPPGYDENPNAPGEPQVVSMNGTLASEVATPCSISSRGIPAAGGDEAGGATTRGRERSRRARLLPVESGAQPAPSRVLVIRADDAVPLSHQVEDEPVNRRVSSMRLNFAMFRDECRRLAAQRPFCRAWEAVPCLGGLRPRVDRHRQQRGAKGRRHGLLRQRHLPTTRGSCRGAGG